MNNNNINHNVQDSNVYDGINTNNESYLDHSGKKYYDSSNYGNDRENANNNNVANNNNLINHGDTNKEFGNNNNNDNTNNESDDSNTFTNNNGGINNGSNNNLYECGNTNNNINSNDNDTNYYNSISNGINDRDNMMTNNNQIIYSDDIYNDSQNIKTINNNSVINSDNANNSFHQFVVPDKYMDKMNERNNDTERNNTNEVTVHYKIQGTNLDDNNEYNAANNNKNDNIYSTVETFKQIINECSSFNYSNRSRNYNHVSNPNSCDNQVGTENTNNNNIDTKKSSNIVHHQLIESNNCHHKNSNDHNANINTSNNNNHHVVTNMGVTITTDNTYIRNNIMHPNQDNYMTTNLNTSNSKVTNHNINGMTNYIGRRNDKDVYNVAVKETILLNKVNEFMSHNVTSTMVSLPNYDSYNTMRHNDNHDTTNNDNVDNSMAIDNPGNNNVDTGINHQQRKHNQFVTPKYINPNFNNVYDSSGLSNFKQDTVMQQNMYTETNINNQVNILLTNNVDNKSMVNNYRDYNNYINNNGNHNGNESVASSNLANNTPEDNWHSGLILLKKNQHISQTIRNVSGSNVGITTPAFNNTTSPETHLNQNWISFGKTDLISNVEEVNASTGNIINGITVSVQHVPAMNPYQKQMRDGLGHQHHRFDKCNDTRGRNIKTRGINM